MVIGYAGLRYLEVSIVSPIQNASGAFSMIAMLIIFAVTGTVQDDLGDLSPLNLVGTVLIVLGVITLAILENLLARREANRVRSSGDPIALEPMSPYERRILHATLQDNPYVTTHSEGEEPNRYVVISPAQAEAQE